jgi:hypothetical protein
MVFVIKMRLLPFQTYINLDSLNKNSRRLFGNLNEVVIFATSELTNSNGKIDFCRNRINAKHKHGLYVLWIRVCRRCGIRIGIAINK